MRCTRCSHDIHQHEALSPLNPPDQRKSYRYVADFLLGCRQGKKPDSKAWNQFKVGLDFVKDPSFARAVDLWTMENLERHRPELVRLRVLHEIEQQFIGTESHGMLLEALHQGMLNPMQIEGLLDELASRESGLVIPRHLQDLLAKTWSRNVGSLRSVRPS